MIGLLPPEDNEVGAVSQGRLSAFLKWKGELLIGERDAYQIVNSILGCVPEKQGAHALRLPCLGECGSGFDPTLLVGAANFSSFSLNPVSGEVFVGPAIDIAS
jgi:hypothetical protein